MNYEFFSVSCHFISLSLSPSPDMFAFQRPLRPTHTRDQLSATRRHEFCLQSFPPHSFSEPNPSALRHDQHLARCSGPCRSICSAQHCFPHEKIHDVENVSESGRGMTGEKNARMIHNSLEDCRHNYRIHHSPSEERKPHKYGSDVCLYMFPFLSPYQQNFFVIRYFPFAARAEHMKREPVILVQVISDSYPN
jgi:hypothetical protein